MRRRDSQQLDVFADRPGAGNPLAVVLDARDLDTAAMQAFANWTNLSETTFVLPPLDAHASYRVRIFTPRQELPFAGHPSVGLAVYGRVNDAADHGLAVRAFCPADGIPEDPVTGSANAAIAAWLAENGALAALGSRYVASQGREVGRDGRIEVRVDKDGEVWIGGCTRTLIRGTLDW
jgi:predicted PhzF superfamily epimerase YddE/YHI9